MIKKLSLIMMALMLGGCSTLSNMSMPEFSLPTFSMPSLSVPDFLKFGDEEETEPAEQVAMVDQTVKISSECKIPCQALVEASFSIDPLRTVSGRDKPVYDYVILNSVNGIRGRKTSVDSAGSFNSPQDGSFEISTLPGPKELELRPTYESDVINNTENVSFTAQPGRQYLVGSMGWRRFDQNESIQINYWHPVVVDLSRNQVVYPTSDPQWNKYCTANQTNANSVTCPLD